MTDLLKESADRPARLVVPIDASVDHILGPADAPVTLLEYGDYECPDCGQAYPMLDEIRRRVGQSLRFVFRHFPLYTVHSHASQAAQAAESAGAQGKFWEMHDLLYRNQQRLDPPDLTHYALRIGLEVYKFDQAMSADRYAPRIERDYSGGQRSGVRGTPTLFINDGRYEGPIQVEPIVAAIQAAMPRT